jgi:hypothetical protein
LFLFSPTDYCIELLRDKSNTYADKCAACGNEIVLFPGAEVNLAEAMQLIDKDEIIRIRAVAGGGVKYRVGKEGSMAGDSCRSGKRVS